MVARGSEIEIVQSRQHSTALKGEGPAWMCTTLSQQALCLNIFKASASYTRSEEVLKALRNRITRDQA